MRRPFREALSKILPLLLLFATAASAAPKEERYTYGCRFVGSASEGETEMFNFPFTTPSAAAGQPEKVAQSSRKTTLTVEISYGGKLKIRYVDNIYRLNLGSFYGSVAGVNPEAGKFGKIEKTFTVTKKHSFPYSKYTLSCK